MTDREKLFKTTKVHDKIVNASTLLDEHAKAALHEQATFIRDFLSSNPKANSYQLKTLANEILTYWNESITPDIETFWTEMQQENIGFERKEPLRFALQKGRFRNVEQSIAARNYWSFLAQLPTLKNRYSQAEIEQLGRIISEDEKKRYEVLKKCLASKSIPQTQYLKFGECMAYYERCNLFVVNFSTEQIEELYSIWTNFK